MKYIYTISLILIYTATCSSQTIDRVKGNRYSYQDSLYRSFHLSDVMSQNQAAFTQYQKYLRLEKDKDTAAQVGLISVGGGLFFVVVGTILEYRSGGGMGRNGDSSTAPVLIYGGLGVSSAGFLVALFGLYPSQHVLNDAIDIYNNNLPAIGMTSSIGIGQTANGVGLIYSF